MQSLDVVDIDYQKSVLGIFNLGVAIAHLKGNADLQTRFESAQMEIVKLIKEERKPTQQEAAFISSCFNVADRLIGIQHKELLGKAILFVDKMIEESRAQRVTEFS